MIILKSGFSGLSFPFRVSGTGGIEMSTTSVSDISHITEAIEQILLTRPRERKMEYHFKSDLDTLIFEPNDESLKSLMVYHVEEALKELEDRIEVLDVDFISEDNVIYVLVTFRVLIYDTVYTKKIKVGDVNADSNG